MMDEETGRGSPLRRIAMIVSVVACVISIAAAVVTYRAAHRVRTPLVWTAYYDDGSFSDGPPFHPPSGLHTIKGVTIRGSPFGEQLRKEIEAANRR